MREKVSTTPKLHYSDSKVTPLSNVLLGLKYTIYPLINMPVGYEVSTETTPSVVKNFKKQSRFYSTPEETLIRVGDKVSDKSAIYID